MQENRKYDWKIQGKRTACPDYVIIEKKAICNVANVFLRYVGSIKNSDKEDIRGCTECRIRLLAPLFVHGTYSFDRKSGMYYLPEVESGEFETLSGELLEVNDIVKECEKIAEVMISDVSVILKE